MRTSSLAARPPPRRPVLPSSPLPASSCRAFLRRGTGTNLTFPVVTSAAQLVDSIRAELSPIRDRLLAHPYVAAVEEGRLTLEQLRPFAGEQYAIISSDLRSVAHLVSRFGGDFFLEVLAGERAALQALPAFAAALGMGEEDLRDYEPLPEPHAYAAYMAWLAAYASAAEVAAAYVVNFQAWGENCGRLSRALGARYGLGSDAVEFFDLFAAPAAAPAAGLRAALLGRPARSAGLSAGLSFSQELRAAADPIWGAQHRHP